MRKLEEKMERLQSEYSQVCDILQELGVEIEQQEDGAHIDSDN